MDNVKSLLKEAASEIKRLRNENTLMSARLNMFDTMTILLNTSPFYTSKGFSPDVVYEIEKQIIKLEETPVS